MMDVLRYTECFLLAAASSDPIDAVFTIYSHELWYYQTTSIVLSPFCDTTGVQ